MAISYISMLHSRKRGNILFTTQFIIFPVQSLNYTFCFWVAMIQIIFFSSLTIPNVWFDMKTDSNQTAEETKRKDREKEKARGKKKNQYFLYFCILCDMFTTNGLMLVCACAILCFAWSLITPIMISETAGFCSLFFITCSYCSCWEQQSLSWRNLFVFSHFPHWFYPSPHHELDLAVLYFI